MISCNRRRWMSLIMAAPHCVMALAVTACAPPAPHPTAAALATALERAEGDGSKARIDYFKMSPSRTLYCGHARVGGRSAVFAIRWNPELHGEPHVLQQPSIDKAPPAERDKVRDAFMKVTLAITETCLREGAPLGA